MAKALARIHRSIASNATVNLELQYLGQAYRLKENEIGQGPSIPKLTVQQLCPHIVALPLTNYSYCSVRTPVVALMQTLGAHGAWT